MNSSRQQLINKSILSGLVKLMRPKQWIKNSFVMAPLLFAELFNDYAAIINALSATVLFCLASSATYIINDYFDIEIDKKHPKKSLERPLASGQVPIPTAFVLLIILLLPIIFGFALQPEVVVIISAYLVLNVAYSIRLKHEPVIDIFCIATSFVLRVYAGAISLSVPISPWMFVTTFCLALFLASVKRKQELALSGNAGRKVLRYYTLNLVDKFAQIASTGALLFYSLFVMTARPNMVISIPFVIFGIFRYWYITEIMKSGESPTDVLYSDKQLLLTVFAWVSLCVWILWPVGD